MNLQALLEKSAAQHDHLCPRQVLGVRMGLCGMKALGFDSPPDDKRLLVITETDGCFVDGISAATNCTVGHRTLRLAPALDIRQRAREAAGIEEEALRYQAQLEAYQVMTDEEMFTVAEVRLLASIESSVSHPGLRVVCDSCGEEIMNEREVRQNGLTLCRTCAGVTYYQTLPQGMLVDR